MGDCSDSGLTEALDESDWYAMRIRTTLICGYLGLLGVLAACNRSAVDPGQSPHANSQGGNENRVADASKSGPKKETKKLRQGAPSAEIPKVVPVFQNVARDLGIDFTFFSDAVPERYFLPEVMGGGAAWIDFDLDGDFDVFFTNGAKLQLSDPDQTVHSDQLMMNLGDRFQNVTAESHAGHEGYGQGCAVADFDADGFPDVYVANFGANALFRNNGDGTFENVTEYAGVGDDLWGSSCAWFDANSDGLVDLYLVNYMNVTFETHKVCTYDGQKGYCGPGDYEPSPDRLYINSGDGSFVESLDAMGMTADEGKGLALVITDFDDDLRPEVYVCNDMTPNFLFTRSDNPNARTALDRSKAYVEIGTGAGCAVSDTGLNEASMGVSCGDYDGDGRPDLYLTHFFNAKNTLYQNLGNLTFIDNSKRTGVAKTSMHSLGFGTFAFDYDGDGAMDLFIANGHVLGPNQSPNEMTPQLLRNDGKGRFEDISVYAGEYFVDKWLGRGVAAGDFDNDGDLDIAVSHLDRPVALLRNETKTGAHWLGLELKSKNRVPPVGGRVVVTQGSRKLYRSCFAGGSYLSSHDPRIPIWIADGDCRVEIYWPSGVVDVLENPPLDQYLRIDEGRFPAG